MNKYFKPLNSLFYFNCLGIICWIILLFQQNDYFPMRLKVVILIIIISKQLTYIKWEKFNFDWMLNIIFKKKLQQLNYEYKQQFFHLSKHKDQYFDDYGDLSIVNSSLFESYQISRVCTRYRNNKIVFCIELKRPGILIGKRGENINEIEKELGINLHIVECKDLWFNKNNNIF